MKVRVKFFAILRERAGAGEVTKDIQDGSTVAELWRGLQKDYPKLDVPGIRLLYAVNQNYVGLDHRLGEGDEVVFVPPVSGGGGSMFRVTHQPIDLRELVAYVTDPEAGAIATFIGTTRNNNEGRNVIALEYEAYSEMAEKELTRIGADAAKKWQICRMAIVHRLGPVQIGEASVVIAVSSAHREAAFAASRFAIEEIKKTVPIWKKEVFEGGEVWIGTQTGQPLNAK
jgi:molybdopterin synthase catalytic subunit